MRQIEAIYRHGVFEPLEPVDLKEEQRVRLTIDAEEEELLDVWLERARRLREEIFKRQGYLPDSAREIAEDRRR